MVGRYHHLRTTPYWYLWIHANQPPPEAPVRIALQNVQPALVPNGPEGRGTQRRADDELERIVPKHKGINFVWNVVDQNYDSATCSMNHFWMAPIGETILLHITDELDYE